MYVLFGFHMAFILHYFMPSRLSLKLLSIYCCPIHMQQEQQMMKLMGFAGFDSTKGKGVEDNKKGPAKGATSKHKEREYRQYMNRRGTYVPPRYMLCRIQPLTDVALAVQGPDSGTLPLDRLRFASRGIPTASAPFERISFRSCMR